MLCWVHGKGYSLFHTGLNLDTIEVKLTPKMVFDYLDELNDRAYPYDMIVLRYNIGSDNGPCDPGLPDAVKAWNEKYETPTVRISTVTEAFRAFEKKYGDEVPALRGDLTPYWEDGAASSARETAVSRAAAERLTQAEVLWTLLDPTSFPRGRFRAAWREVLLYTEHTWGAWNSISDPESDFARGQWAVKRDYTRQADTASRALLEEALGKTPAHAVDCLDVVNTSSWDRSGLVVIPPDHRLRGDLVRDAAGTRLPSQRLSTGGLAVQVAKVPALGVCRLFFEKGDVWSTGDAFVKENRIGNGVVELEIDPESGAIRSLRHGKATRNLVDTGAWKGLNDFVYVAGRNPDNRKTIQGPVRIVVKEKGPLVAEVAVESGAPGCEKLIREIRMTAGTEQVGLTTVVDKRKVYDPEAVHLTFPFAVPDGRILIDVAFGQYRPEIDQIAGSCKNYFTAQRWVDVSNEDFGVTLALPDAPLVEIGRITCDAISCGWAQRASSSQTLFSYLMNNYWETNYCAAQSGRHAYRYALMPHLRFNSAQAERFGIEQSQPLLIAQARGDRPPTSLVRLEADSPLVVTRIRPGKQRGEVLLTVFNASARQAALGLESAGAWLSDVRGRRGAELRADPILPGWGIRHILVKVRDR